LQPKKPNKLDLLLKRLSDTPVANRWQLEERSPTFEQQQPRLRAVLHLKLYVLCL